MVAVEALEPIYEKAEDLAPPGRGAAHPAGARQGRRVAGAAAAAHRRAGGGAGPRRGGLRRLRRGLPGGSHLGAGPRGAGGSGRQPRQLGDPGGPLRRGPAAAASSTPSWSASCCCGWRWPTTRSWASRQKAVEYFQRAQEIEPEDPAALDALERLYTRTERWPDLVDTLRKKAELPGLGRGARAHPRPDRHLVGGGDRQPRGGHRRLEGRPGRQPRAACWRCGPSSACSSSAGSTSSWPTTCSGSSS